MGHLPAREHEDLIQLCFEVGSPSLCERLFLRLLDPPGIDIPVHISKVLVPFVPMLQKHLTKLGIDLTAQPFAHFCSQVIHKFVKVVVGQRPSQGALTVPSSELAGLECKDRCAHCRQLRAFFVSEQKEISFREAQKIRSHVEYQVGMIQKLGITCATIRVGSPHTLQVSRILIVYWNGASMTTTCGVDFEAGWNSAPNMANASATGRSSHGCAWR